VEKDGPTFSILPSENSNLLEIYLFFTCQTNLQLAITQDLPSEFYQVVGEEP
jgi:hypothetical protein